MGLEKANHATSASDSPPRASGCSQLPGELVCTMVAKLLSRRIAATLADKALEPSWSLASLTRPVRSPSPCASSTVLQCAPLLRLGRRIRRLGSGTCARQDARGPCVACKMRSTASRGVGREHFSTSPSPTGYVPDSVCACLWSHDSWVRGGMQLKPCMAAAAERSTGLVEPRE